MSKTIKQNLVDDCSTVTMTSGVDYTIGPIDPTWTIGAVGGTYTMSNISLSNNLYSTGTGVWPATSSSQSGLMELQGDNADIKINGRSLMEAIDALEQRLNIMVPNPELEAEWDELRELGDRYRELEKQCKEKGRMWFNLKEIKK